jgi:4-amino-4-deoxy-L-arabinose transferase-like glycosyltransferase
MLGGFILLCTCCSFFFSRSAEALLPHSDRPADHLVAGRLWRALRESAAQIPSLVRMETLIVCALVLAYGLFWATYAQVSSSAGVHIDSLEAYAWGREFRLGYYKHPPFWAWVAGLWFMVLPKTDWCFWLLSELNGALGLAGAYALMGRFCGQRTRLLCVLLLMLTPFYQFNALRFNANTVLLSIWPWTMYFFVRCMETRRVVYAITCGVLAGFALLSKYFGLVLIISCVLASLTHHHRKSYYASAAPYISLLVATAIFAPHVFWLFRDGFQPLAYMATKIDLRDRAISDSFFQFIGASAAFFIAPLALLLLARWRGGVAKPALPAPENGRSFENVIAFSPFILTLIAGSVGHTALAIPFGVPIFSLAALPLLRLVGPDEEKALAYARNAVLTLMAACAIAGPFLPSIFIGMNHKDHIRPHAEAAQAAIALWREKTGAPLRFAGGDRMNSLSITFRSGENTSELNSFNLRWSPAATPETLRRHGLYQILLISTHAPIHAIRWT